MFLTNKINWSVFLLTLFNSVIYAERRKIINDTQLLILLFAVRKDMACFSRE